MVVTPNQRPVELRGSLSPLLLPTDTGDGSAGPSRPPLRQATGSSSRLSDFTLDDPALSVDTPSVDGDAPANSLAGVQHVTSTLDATQWRHPVFKAQVLSVLRKLKVPLWTSDLLTPSSIHLQKVSGALTNAVFFVSFNPRPEPTSPSLSPMLTPTMPASDPSHPPTLTPNQFPPTLLLRIYPPSLGSLIVRSEELRILHVLSTVYGLGPRIYGTLGNGRVEQFFPSRALTPEELRDPHVSRGIARRMRELHSVDLRILGYEQGREGEPTVWRQLKDWTVLAEQVLGVLESLGGQWEIWVEKFGLHRVKDEVQLYMDWVAQQDGRGKGVVFAHNDTQYGNLLLLDRELPKGAPEHHRYIVIDFEYAAPNPRGYDIANHFHEWRANYHHPTHSHSLKPHFPYPDPKQREDFYRAYLSIEMDARNGEEVMVRRKDVQADRVERLEREVRIWSPACSVVWALWGIAQAEEQVAAMRRGETVEVEFDYLQYAAERLEMFREEARELGMSI